MDRGEIRRLWDVLGGGQAAAPAGHTGPGLMGLPLAGEPHALAGVALAALGLAAGSPPDAPAAVRAASSAYAGWVGPAGLRGADYGDVVVASDDLEATFVRAHERLADILAAGAMPLVLGGDAIATLPVLQVLSGKLRGRLGVVALTPAYDIAAEPLYAASSRWSRALELGVVVPANLVLVGGRAAPPDRLALRVLDGLGVSTYSAADVARDGVMTVAEEALEAAATGTEAVYLSVDMRALSDVTDPVGLTARELAAGAAVVASGLLAAADICGVEPGTAGGGPARVAARVAAEIFAGVAGRPA
jgi:arginase family enzyme